MIILPANITSSVEKKLALDSTKGNPIDNGQYNEISAFEMNQLQFMKEKWKNHLGFRCGPTARYNCHGMTFASRRTGIYDAKTITQILNEDDYRLIKEPKDILPGDVIMYYSSEGDVEHSGVVISNVDSQFGVPKVLSKWGKYAELIHWANQCPYSFINAKYYRISV